ncbi:MAG: hypothetical protein AAGD04_11750 [Pseudomonadota bacterium]
MEGAAGLWLAVLGIGLYHGVNPGMGWPLAVSAALMERRETALWRALGALGFGHLVSMLGILLPFAAMSLLVTWQYEIQIASALLLIGLGLYLFVRNRHPRILARIPPHKLALWSFVIALAHGAGLMLVPIFLGLCAPEMLDAGHMAASQLMTRNIGMALLVAFAHTATMLIGGAAIAFAVYKWLGLKFLTQSWFDLERVWAASLIVVGLLGIWAAQTHAEAVLV